jgi:hypothetical protein
MDGISLIGPAVVAAVISGLVSSIGIWISVRTSRAIHTEKLTFDREQSERRVNAEIVLAEKKFAIDRAIVGWRRRYDLAEQLLTSAYDARDALNWARVRAVMSGEGATRQAAESETDELRRLRNSIFVPLERLRDSAKTFTSLQASKYAIAAHFGPESIEPIAAILGVHHSISTAASILVEMTQADDDRRAREALIPLRKTLWGDRPDENDNKLDAAINQLEAICRPILSEQLPA